MGTHLPTTICAMGLFGDRLMYDNGHVYATLISFGPMFGLKKCPNMGNWKKRNKSTHSPEP